MVCTFCKGLTFYKSRICWLCKKLGKGKVKAEKKVGKSYLDIVTDNMERKYPGKGKEKALKTIKISKSINGFNY